MPWKTEVTAESPEPFSFGKITFTRPGTYRYRVAQAVPSEARDNGDGTRTAGGVTYDASVHIAAASVSAGDGAPSVTWTYDDGEELVIRNTAEEEARYIFGIPVGDTRTLLMYAAAASVLLIIAVALIAVRKR